MNQVASQLLAARNGVMISKLLDGAIPKDLNFSQNDCHSIHFLACRLHIHLFNQSHVKSDREIITVIQAEVGNHSNKYLHTTQVKADTT